MSHFRAFLYYSIVRIYLQWKKTGNVVLKKRFFDANERYLSTFYKKNNFSVFLL